MVEPSPRPQYPDADRLLRNFQLGFRVGAVVAALALALGVVSMVSSPAETDEAVWVVSE
jgi:hypothetical protein